MAKLFVIILLLYSGFGFSATGRAVESYIYENQKTPIEITSVRGKFGGYRNTQEYANHINELLDTLPEEYQKPFISDISNINLNQFGAKSDVERIYYTYKWAAYVKDREELDKELAQGYYRIEKGLFDIEEPYDSLKFDPDSKIVKLRKNFSEKLRDEHIDKNKLKFFVITDTTHVIDNLKNYPENNIIDAKNGANKAAILDFFAKHEDNLNTEPTEVYLIAEHENGDITLRPSGEKIKFDILKTEAQKKGILLHLWGCKSALNASHGIMESFNYGALVKLIGNFLVDNKNKQLTRASFYYMLSNAMGINFGFKLSDYDNEKHSIKVQLIAKDKARKEQLEKMFNEFELKTPKGYTSNINSNLTPPESDLLSALMPLFIFAVILSFVIIMIIKFLVYAVNKQKHM